jgi:hypothetical protein
MEKVGCACWASDALGRLLGATYDSWPTDDQDAMQVFYTKDRAVRHRAIINS